MKRSTCMIIQTMVTGFATYIVEVLGMTVHMLVILMALMVADYFSGMIASSVEATEHPKEPGYGWSSKKGAKGIAKKGASCIIKTWMLKIENTSEYNKTTDWQVSKNLIEQRGIYHEV